MATTHAAMGVLFATPVLWVAPDVAAPAALGAMAGGVFPDFDVGVLEHRKTLHYPEHYWPLAAAAFAAAVAAPSVLTVAAAFFVLSAAVHSVTDALGGGLGARPWANDDQRGVYSHYRGRWIRPRRWIRYDGAPEDLLAVVVLSAPGVALYGGLVRDLTLAMLGVSVVYTLLRKRLPAFDLA
ncbi:MULTISPECIES: metal-dependent hydrolase [Halobacterium]|uniref:metal-dependent hydrolase n=1 Tax=Halobacterium TaxID=2239 RepID=UPI000AC66640|nr:MULTISPECIES: metal-dependent hydrolase [Halobacterium]MCG1004060.1 metal-dependent hydrolase [Halobacterium noricense]